MVMCSANEIVLATVAHRFCFFRFPPSFCCPPISLFLRDQDLRFCREQMDTLHCPAASVDASVPSGEDILAALPSSARSLSAGIHTQDL